MQSHLVAAGLGPLGVTSRFEGQSGLPFRSTASQASFSSRTLITSAHKFLAARAEIRHKRATSLDRMGIKLNRIEAINPGADPGQQAASLAALKPFKVATRFLGSSAKPSRVSTLLSPGLLSGIARFGRAIGPAHRHRCAASSELKRHTWVSIGLANRSSSSFIVYVPDLVSPAEPGQGSAATGSLNVNVSSELRRG